MRKLIVLLGALAFGWTAPVEGATAPLAPLGNQFCKLDNPTPVELADVMIDAITKDPKGLTMLDPSRCHMARPARPVDYLEMFKIDDPGAGLTDVQQLPAYLSKLEIRKALPGKYWVACLKQSARSSSGWAAVHNCLSTEFQQAWFNPVTGRSVLKPDCTNPIGQPEQVENCGHIYVMLSERESALRLQESGPKQIDGQCVGVKRPGQTDYENPYVEECPELLCDFKDVNAVLEPLGFTPQRKGSLVAVAGVFDFLVPLYVTEKDSNYLFTFCTERWQGPAPVPPKYPAPGSTPEVVARYVLDREEYITRREEWRLTHSCGTTVKWVDYVSKEGTRIATLYYDQATARKAGTLKADGQPTDLYWYWKDEQDRCVVR